MNSPYRFPKDLSKVLQKDDYEYFLFQIPAGMDLKSLENISMARAKDCTTHPKHNEPFVTATINLESFNILPLGINSKKNLAISGMCTLV